MRLIALSLLLVAPILAACDSGTPPAQTSTAASTPAKPAAVKPAAPAGFPFNARPLLGTWGTDAEQCAGNAVVVTATTYAVGAQSAALTLTDNGNGTFAATAGNQKMTLEPIFGPAGEGIRIAQGSGKPTNVFRCAG